MDRGPWKFGQMLGKIKKIRTDLSENRLNSGNFITILHKIRAETFNCPPPPRKVSAPYGYGYAFKLNSKLYRVHV